MKTYVLDRVTSVEQAKAELFSVLPDGILYAPDGDAIAYFEVIESDIDTVGPAITADISGRHYDEDEAVIAVLKTFQRMLGGVIDAAP